MSLEEISNNVAALGSAWEEFKKVNDARLKEIEKKGAADPLREGVLERINGFMDETKSTLDATRNDLDLSKKEIDGLKRENDTLRTALVRPGAGAFEPKDGSPEIAEYKAAFVRYIRKGHDEGLQELSAKALSVNSDPDGGYVVTPQMSAQMTKIIYETSPIRQIASVETITSDSLDIIDDVDEASGSWVGEAASRSDTDTPQFGKRNIPTHELYAQPKATQKLIDDGAVDIESWLAGKIAEIFSRKQNTAFVSGSGVLQPRGFLTYAAGTTWGKIEQVASGSSGAVTADGLITLFYSLKSEYMRNSTFLMNRSVVGSVRKLKETSTDNYLWQPGLAAGQPDMLLGVPLMMATDMPVAAADSLSVAVGDFKRAYQIVDRIGIRTLRDPFTEKPFVKFYSTVRVGGDVVNFEAIKLQKLASS